MTRGQCLVPVLIYLFKLASSERVRLRIMIEKFSACPILNGLNMITIIICFHR